MNVLPLLLLLLLVVALGGRATPLNGHSLELKGYDARDGTRRTMLKRTLSSEEEFLSRLHACFVTCILNFKDQGCQVYYLGKQS